VASARVKNEVVAAGADVIDLDLGNPDQPTPPAIVEQLHMAADIGRYHRYHPGRGLIELRGALSAWYERRYAVSFDPERHVVVSMGAKEGMTSLCLATLDRGDTVLAPDPCYPIHRGAPIIAGASVVTYPSTAPDPARVVSDLLRSCRREGRRVKMVVANYPQNPTGRTISKQALGALVQVVADSGALMLHDLAYADLDFAVRYAPSIFDCGVDADRVAEFAVEVFSMSKSYHMPGWRIGYVAGSERLVNALSHLKTYTDYGTFVPVQYASAWALTHGDDIASAARELYRCRATALVNGLRAAGFGDVEEPAGTMFVWTRVPEALGTTNSLEAVNELIVNAHVAVTPGSGFGPGGEGFVRFALIEDPPRILEATARLGRYLRSRAPSDKAPSDIGAMTG
jgi:alanine-synthesizing transaminase